MKRELHKVAATLFAAIFLVSCNIDDDYNLSKLNSDEVGIGTDDTYFDLPLLKVTIRANEAFMTSSASELIDTKYSSRTEVTYDDAYEDIYDDLTTYDEDSELTELTDLEKLNALLPNQVIDLSKLKSDYEYAKEIVTALIEELKADQQKCEDFCEEVNDNPDYSELQEQIESDLNVSLDDPLALQDALNDTSNDIDDLIESLTVKLQSQVSELTSTVVEAGSIDIGSDVIDLLNRNIDGDKNTLRILIDIEHDLDIEITFDATLVYSGGNIVIPTYSEEELTATQLSGLIPTVDLLEQILANLTLELDFNITNYDPSKGLDAVDKTIIVTLVAHKTGSLKF